MDTETKNTKAWLALKAKLLEVPMTPAQRAVISALTKQVEEVPQVRQQVQQEPKE